MKIKIKNPKNIKFSSIIPKVGQLWKHPSCHEVWMRIDGDVSVVVSDSGGTLKKGYTVSRLDDGWFKERDDILVINDDGTVVDEPTTRLVKISNDYTAVISKDGIQVGCTDVSWEVFDEICKAAKEIRK